MFVVTVVFEIAPGRMPEFLPLMRAQAKTSLDREPGCRHFDVCVSSESGSVFLYEIYADEAAFQKHLESPHYREFDAATASLVADKRVQFHRLLD